MEQKLDGEINLFLEPTTYNPLYFCYAPYHWQVLLLLYLVMNFRRLLYFLIALRMYSSLFLPGKVKVIEVLSDS
jgi:hypothetical protein